MGCFHAINFYFDDNMLASWLYNDFHLTTQWISHQGTLLSFNIIIMILALIACSNSVLNWYTRWLVILCIWYAIFNFQRKNILEAYFVWLLFISFCLYFDRIHNQELMMLLPKSTMQCVWKLQRPRKKGTRRAKNRQAMLSANSSKKCLL